MPIRKVTKSLAPEIREQKDFNVSGGTGGSGTMREAFSRVEQVGDYWRSVEQDIRRQIKARRAQKEASLRTAR